MTLGNESFQFKRISFSLWTPRRKPKLESKYRKTLRRSFDFYLFASVKIDHKNNIGKQKGLIYNL